MPTFPTLPSFSDSDPAGQWTRTNTTPSVATALQEQFNTGVTDFLGDQEYQEYAVTLGADNTDPNLGADGYAIGRYKRLPGNLCIANFAVRFSGSGISAGSGNYHVNLPLDADNFFHNIGSALASGDPVGVGRLHDASAADGSSNSVAYLYTVGLVRFGIEAPFASRVITNSVPFTWATGDALVGRLVYRHE